MGGFFVFLVLGCCVVGTFICAVILAANSTRIRKHLERIDESRAVLYISQAEFLRLLSDSVGQVVFYKIDEYYNHSIYRYYTVIQGTRVCSKSFSTLVLPDHCKQVLIQVYDRVTEE